MDALERSLFSLCLFCCCPIESGALSISNSVIFFFFLSDLHTQRMQSSGYKSWRVESSISFVQCVRFSVMFLRRSTGYQLASGLRDGTVHSKQGREKNSIILPLFAPRSFLPSLILNMFSLPTLLGLERL